MMLSGRQDLAGKVAALRAECDYFLRVLAELDALSNHHPWLSDAQEDAIARANHNYDRSAAENLQRATADLRNWWGAVDDAITTATTKVAH